MISADLLTEIQEFITQGYPRGRIQIFALFEIPAMQKHEIHFDRPHNKFEHLNLVETLGLFLMKTGAQLTGIRQFFGYSYIAKLVRKVLPSTSMLEVALNDHSTFVFPYGDPYWGRLLNNKVEYEANVQEFLRRIAGNDHAFIDCGANFGFMSILASDPEFGNCPTVAIEADADNFAMLTLNAGKNGNRFDVRHNAVHSTSGVSMNVFGKKHEARSVVPDEGEARGRVDTLAIGDLSDWFAKTGKKHAIIKLDVEGAEIPAIEGMGQFHDNSLLIYEDHGSDKDHSVSRYLLDTAGYRIFEFENNVMQEITDVSALTLIKKNSRYGYDFFATKSPHWLQKIAQM